MAPLDNESNENGIEKEDDGENGGVNGGRGSAALSVISALAKTGAIARMAWFARGR